MDYPFSCSPFSHTNPSYILSIHTESKIYIRTFADIPFSRYNDFKNRHGGIMNMSNKSQTIFAVCLMRSKGNSLGNCSWIEIKICGTHFYYNSERSALKLKGMSTVQYRTHSKAIQYLILSKFLGAFQARQPLFFYSFLSP